MRATGLYDAVLVRTFIPDVFEAQVEELLRASASSMLDRVRTLVPGFRGSVITAVQQLLGMVMKMEAEPVAEVPADLAGPFYRGDIHVVLDDLFDIAVTLVASESSGERVLDGDDRSGSARGRPLRDGQHRCGPPEERDDVARASRPRTTCRRSSR